MPIAIGGTETEKRENTVADIQIGDTAQRTITISGEDVERYREVTGDQNSLHTLATGESRFDRPIVHGMLLAGFVSSVIGMQLPGPGSVYVSQELRFARPVYFGDTVLVTCKVIRFEPETRMTRLRTVIRKEGALVLSGHADVLAP